VGPLVEGGYHTPLAARPLCWWMSKAGAVEVTDGEVGEGGPVLFPLLFFRIRLRAFSYSASLSCSVLPGASCEGASPSLVSRGGEGRRMMVRGGSAGGRVRRASSGSLRVTFIEPELGSSDPVESKVLGRLRIFTLSITQKM